jgi:O-antigen/teichoic acid export membrane protein
MTAERGSTLAGSIGSLGFARIWAQAVQFAGFILAARLLGPEAFGIYALVYLACAFLTLAAALGWAEYAIAHEEDREAALLVAQTIGAVAGVILAVGGAVADRIFDAGGDVALLSLLLAIFIPLRATGALIGSQLIAQNRVVRVAQAQMFSETVGFAIVAACLISGQGILSLAYAKIGQELSGIAFCLTFTGWFRGRLPTRAQLQRMARFAWRMQIGGVAHFAQENIVTLLIGTFFGAAGAGIYRAGARMTSAATEVLAEPMRAISWVSFKRAESEEELRQRVLLVLTGFLSFGAAAFTGLALIAEPLIFLLLGPEWHMAVPIVMLLCIARFLTVATSALHPALAFAEQLHLAPRIAFASAITSVLALLAAAPFGLVAAAGGQVVAGLVTAGLLVWAFHRASGVDPLELLLGLVPAFAACAMMATAVYFILTTGSGEEPAYLPPSAWGALRIGFSVLGGLALFVATLMLLSSRAREFASIGLWRRSPAGPAMGQ